MWEKGRIKTEIRIIPISINIINRDNINIISKSIILVIPLIVQYYWEHDFVITFNIFQRDSETFLVEGILLNNRLSTAR